VPKIGQPWPGAAGHPEPRFPAEKLDPNLAPIWRDFVWWFVPKGRDDGSGGREVMDPAENLKDLKKPDLILS